MKLISGFSNQKEKKNIIKEKTVKRATIVKLQTSL